MRDPAKTDLAGISLIGSALFVVASLASLAVPDIFEVPFVAVSIALFSAGCVAFLWAYAKSLARSRHEQVSVAGIFALAGSAPSDVRRRFHLLTTVQLVVAVTCAALRPFTLQAFGILVPMFGLGLGGLWAAQHGTFAPRAVRKGSQQHG